MKVKTTTEYQPKTGAKCGCRRGVQRDNCPHCEGTGWIIDFAKIRAANCSSVEARRAMNHSKLVGRDCAKRAKAKYGSGWAYMSYEQKQGAISYEVVSVLLAQSAMPLLGEDTLKHCQDVARAALYPEEPKTQDARFLPRLKDSKEPKEMGWVSDSGKP